MKKSVKSLVLITIAVLFFNNSNAQIQIKLPAANSVTSDVKKVIGDHPNHFANLKGEMISQTTQTTEYACTFDAHGAEETTITRYSSKKEIYSWQAVMLTTESFDKAKQKFRSLFNQVNNLSVKTGDQVYKFKGDYEQPDEKKKFSSLILSAGDESKLKIEISMQAYEPMDWKIKIIVYDKEREDDEKGSRTEE